METAAGSLRDLRVAEVTKMDMKVENGKVAGISHARVALVQVRWLNLISSSHVVLRWLLNADTESSGAVCVPCALSIRTMFQSA